MKIPSSGKVNSLRIGKSKKNHHIFGRPLEKLLELQGDSSGIPFIVQDTVSWLRSHGTKFFIPNLFISKNLFSS